MTVSPPPSGEAPQPAAPQPAEQAVTVRLPSAPVRVTYIILGLTVVVYALQFLTEMLFGVDLPAALGAKYNSGIQAGQLWRLITPVLLHGSLIHIGFNMYALNALGPGLERYYGRKRFIVLYLLAGFAGNVASFLFSQAPSLGASTAMFGLVAAEGIFIYRNRFLFGRRSQQLLMNIAGVVVINLILGLSPGIDNWGHLGGLFGGLGFAWLAGPVYKVAPVPMSAEFMLQDQTSPAREWQAAAGVALLFAAAAFINIVLN